MEKFFLKSAALAAVIAGIMLPSAAMAVPVTYTNPTDVTIPENDSGGITTDIIITDSGILSGLTVEIAVDHTWVGDLIFTLTGPNGTVITLMDRPGNPNSTFGDSSNLSAASPITFDDSASVMAEDAGASLGGNDIITGSFAPDMLLSSFNGIDILGTWTLFVSDNAGGDEGAIDSWSLHIEASSVPEPGAIALLGLGLAGFGVASRRRKA